MGCIGLDSERAGSRTLEISSRRDRHRDCAKFESSRRFRGLNMNPKKKSYRCRASASIQALDLAISRFIHSLGSGYQITGLSDIRLTKTLSVVQLWTGLLVLCFKEFAGGKILVLIKICKVCVKPIICTSMYINFLCLVNFQPVFRKSFCIF